MYRNKSYKSNFSTCRYYFTNTYMIWWYTSIWIFDSSIYKLYVHIQRLGSIFPSTSCMYIYIFCIQNKAKLVGVFFSSHFRCKFCMFYPAFVYCNSIQYKLNGKANPSHFIWLPKKWQLHTLPLIPNEDIW